MSPENTPRSMLNAVHAVSHCILPKNLWGSRFYFHSWCEGETKPRRFRELSNEKLRVLNNRLHFVKVPNLENPCKLYVNITPPEAPTRARTVHVKWKVMFRAQRGNYVVTRKVHGEENLGVDSGSATFQPHGLSSVSNPPWVRFLRPRNENNNTYCINLLGLP